MLKIQNESLALSYVKTKKPNHRVKLGLLLSSILDLCPINRLVFLIRGGSLLKDDI